MASIENTVTIDLRKVAQNLRLGLHQVERVVELLDAQNTIPFITRYRKDQTGGLDEEQIRAIQSQATLARMLAERKQTILRSIQSQGKLTPELQEKIETAQTVKVLEDLYLPYKPKKQTLATVARQKGLEPLAREILAADPMCADLDQRAADFIDAEQKVVPTAAEALLGAGHILAEDFSEQAELRGRLRQIVRRSGKLAAVQIEGADAERAKEFRDYFEFSEPLDKLPPHRVLALNRGERAKVLRVKLDADFEAMQGTAVEFCVAPEHPHGEFLKGCALDALERLILPSLEREVRRELTEKAETHAVQVFARNLRNLLLQPPIRGRRVLAIDPGFRTGCKLAAVDEFGNLLEHGVIFLVGKEERKAEAPQKLEELIRKHQISVVAIGNGTACRETEELIAGLISGPLAELQVAYVIVNEAGASVYSTSQLGREELSQLDATTRSGVSIGRRLQDPLSELVKIEPQHIGVGLYQHDLKQKHLQQSLDEVVESCVNYVGVDLNTASVALLRYVSGLNQLMARRIFEHRQAQGPFKNREQLKDVSGIGGVTFTQAAGFLKVADGDCPFDSTWIHPESYEAAKKILEKIGFPEEALRDGSRLPELAAALQTLDIPALAAELGLGELALSDIVADLARPGRDPREDLPPPIFKRGILRVEDLETGMELTGTVLNVVDFGAFVDVGLKDSGLVHISELANQYIRSPHDVVAVGDVVKVWVLQIDKERRRVSLSMIPPGTKTPAPPRGEQGRQPRGERRGPPQGAGQGGPGRGPAQGQPGQPQGEQRGGQGQGGQGGRGRGRRPQGQGASQGGGEHAQQPAMEAAPQDARNVRPPRVPGPVRGPQKKGAGRRPDRRDGDRKGGFGGGHGGGHEQHVEQAPVPEKKKKLKTPALTEGMKVGKEPLRSFGDLMQLIKLKEEDPKPAPVVAQPTEASAPAEPAAAPIAAVEPPAPAPAAPPAAAVESEPAPPEEPRPQPTESAPETGGST